jgi:hypothetical protein
MNKVNNLASNLVSLRNKPRARPSGERPSLVDRKRPFFTGVDRFGINKWSTYLGDPFHTLLNLPWWASECLAQQAGRAEDAVCRGAAGICSSYVCMG